MSQPKPLIVITGASSGIGAAIAKHFSEAGHALLLIARRLDRLEELNLPHCICSKVDITEPKEFRDAIAQAESVYGPTECLVNNAGMMLLGDISDQDPAEWRKMYELNVLSLLDGMQAVLAPMKERTSGTIINISSVAGRKSFPNHAAYCGSKFAVHAISENVREEVAPFNVRVITIAPGAVETELLSHTSAQEIKDGYENWKNDIGGALNPTDIANAVLFAFQQPQSVCIREIVIARTKQTT